MISSSGGRESRDEWSPVEAAVAQQSYEATWALNTHTLGRLLYPGVRVVRVWRDPGHCAPNEPGGGEPAADYRAEVRAFSWFGIPGPTVEVTCGGLSYAVRLRARSTPPPSNAVRAPGAPPQ